MGDMLKKVQPGDPLKIPAATFNAMIDAARDYQNRQRYAGRTAQAFLLQAGIATASTSSASTRPSSPRRTTWRSSRTAWP